MVMARDFGHKGLRISHLAADILSSHVLWRSLDSTPVVETLWRRAMAEAEHAVERTRVIVGIACVAMRRYYPGHYLRKKRACL